MVAYFQHLCIINLIIMHSKCYTLLYITDKLRFPQAQHINLHFQSGPLSCLLSASVLVIIHNCTVHFP